MYFSLFEILFINLLIPLTIAFIKKSNITQIIILVGKIPIKKCTSSAIGYTAEKDAIESELIIKNVLFPLNTEYKNVPIKVIGATILSIFIYSFSLSSNLEYGILFVNVLIPAIQ